METECPYCKGLGKVPYYHGDLDTCPTCHGSGYVAGPSPVLNLECCCCGEATRGRQWWNRDTGYGICRKCIAWMRERSTTEAEIADLYGQEGVHFDVDEHADLRAILGEALSK